MATRDEILRFILQVQGTEDVSAIGAALRQAGEAGQAAEPEVAALTEELGALADRASAIKSFVGLKAELAEVQTQLGVAKDSLSNLEAEFDRADTTNRRVAASFALADKTIADLTARQTELSVALQKASGTLDKEEIDTANLTAAQEELALAAQKAAAELTARAAASKVSAGANEAEAVTVEELGKKYTAFGRILESIKEIALTIGGLFALEKAKEEVDEILATGDKFQKWGTDFANAFGGAEKGAKALDEVKELAERVPLSLDEVTAAALRAKKEGLDPLEGTLETLIDVNARYGGSAETLGALIDTFGKALARGSLNTKALTTLQQQGVPAAKLLGDAMGKTAVEIEEMANKGEIGRESIKLLLDQLGTSAAGSAAKSMTLLGTLATKVKDQWDEFLKLIADSGVYDFAREKLTQINDALKNGIANGSLKAAAEQISNAIVGIGTAASNAARFVYDHGAAILSAAKAYATLRAAMLSMDLVGMAAKFVGLGAGVESAAGKAAEAAAEGGVFARLAARVNAIPKAVQIAVVTAGVDHVLTQFEEIVDTLRDNSKLVAEDNERQEESNELLDRYAAKAAVLAQELKGYADTRIATTTELTAKDRLASEEYINALQNATRYYAALQIQAKAKSDYKGVEEASEKLRELAEAAEQAKKHLEDLKKNLDGVAEATIPVENKFDDLRTKGQDTAVAVEGAFNGIEINTPTGLDKVVTIIKDISVRTGGAKQAIQTELVGALGKLDDVDLRNFQQSVNDRLKDAKGDAEGLKTALGAALQQEMLRLGLSAEQVGAQFTKGGQGIIATFSDIVRNSQASGEQIQLSFAKALAGAQTEGEVRALKTQLQDAFNAGKINADLFGVASEAAARKLTQIQVAAVTASAGLDGVGKAGETAAQRTIAALDDMRGKLVKQASDLGNQIADLARSHLPIPAALLARYKELQDQVAGLTTEINKEADAARGAANAFESLDTAQAGMRQHAENQAYWNQQTEQGAKNAQDFADSIQKAGERTDDLGERAKALTVAQNAATSSTERAQVAVEGLSQGLEENGGMAQYAADAMKGARAEFEAVSPAAARAFDTIVAGALEAQGILKEVVSSNNVTTFTLKQLHDEAQADFGGGGFAKYFYALELASERTRAEVAAQRKEVSDLAATYNNFAQSTDTSLDQVQNKLGGNLDQLQRLSQSLKDGTYNAHLLGQQDLTGLQEAVDAAIAKVQALKEAADQATQAFSSMGADLQDQLDEAAGNQESIEDRRYQKQLADLKAAAAAAGLLNSAQYQQDVANANALHALKMKQLQQEQQQASGGGSSSGGTGGASSGSSNPAGASVGTGGGLVLAPINIHIDGAPAVTGLYGDGGAAEQLEGVMRALVDHKRRA